MNTTAAFIGTGLMGAPMATRLVRAGFRMKVWNRSREKAQALKPAGAIVCTSPAEAAADASFVCLCLTDAAAVEDVLFGQAALAEALSHKSVVIDFSTIGVTSAEKLGRVNTIERIDDECEIHKKGVHHIQFIEPCEHPPEALDASE